MGGGGGGGSHVGRWRPEPVCLLALLAGTSASEAAADAEARTRPRCESSFPARLLRGEFPEASSAFRYLSSALLFFITHTFSANKTAPPKKQRYV